MDHLPSTSSATKSKQARGSKKRCAPFTEPARQSKRFDSDSEDDTMEEKAAVPMPAVIQTSAATTSTKSSKKVFLNN